MGKLINRGVKIKIYPTHKQKKLIIKEAELHRFIWNKYIEFNLEEFYKGKEALNYVDMYKIHMGIKDLQKDDNDISFYTYPKDSQSVQQQLKRVEDSFKRFKRGISSLPRFKSKKKDMVSFSFPQRMRFNKNKTKVFMPGIGEIRFKGYREFHNMSIKQLVIKVYPNEDIEVVFIVECENQTPPNKKNLNNSIGLDMGVKKFLTDSDGVKIRTDLINVKNGKIVNSVNLKSEIKKLKYLQNKTALCKVEEKYKLYNLVNKQYKRISNIRLNWLHHIANIYVCYKFVAVENLEIIKMTHNTKGTIENKNYDSNRKTRLNDKILKSSWSMFFNILRYKLSDRKSYLMVVNKDYTSQICSVCNIIDSSNRHGEVYSCKNCGNVMDADHNAAINIKNRSENKDYCIKQ